jgi:hypothetical protein
MGIRDLNSATRIYIAAVDHVCTVAIRADKEKWPKSKRDAAISAAKDQERESFKALNRAFKSVDRRSLK